MEILAKVGRALQQLFGEIAETAAAESGVIQRTRKFTALSLARTSCWDFCKRRPRPTRNCAEWPCSAALRSRPKRLSSDIRRGWSTFWKGCFVVRPSWSSARTKPGADPGTVHHRHSVGQFDDFVARRDAGAISRLWRQLRQRRSQAVKLQTELDLRSGALAHVEIEPGRSPDGATEPTGGAAWQGIVADRRLGLLRVGRVRRDGGGGRVFSVAFAVRHARVAASRHSRGGVELAGEAARPVRRCVDSAGARATLAVSFDCVAIAA